jgi:hypothetical protein
LQGVPRLATEVEVGVLEVDPHATGQRLRHLATRGQR